MVIRAIFEKGVFRPLDPLPELDERAEVVLTIRKSVDWPALRKVRGSLTPEEAQKMQQLIKEGRCVEEDW